MYEKIPELLEDKYWDSLECDIPYTEAAEPFRTQVHQGSALDIRFGFDSVA